MRKKRIMDVCDNCGEAYCYEDKKYQICSGCGWDADVGAFIEFDDDSRDGLDVCKVIKMRS